MRRAFRDFGNGLRNASHIGRAGGGSVAQHWALALFSLAAAFAIWYTVQDVENPRAEGVVPVEGEQQIRVEAVNIPDGYIVVDPSPVSVRVRARKADLPTLRAADFRATVDLQGIEREDTVSLAVSVNSRRSGLNVLSVAPSSVQVTLVRAASRDLPITIRTTGSLPEGYQQVFDGRTIKPQFVTVTGLPGLVDSVYEVDVVVSLNGVKDDSAVIEGDLVARTESGNVVAVTLSEQRARVTLKVEQTLVRRSLALNPVVTGSPAPGYRVTDVKIDPPLVGVSGTKPVIDSLTRLIVQSVDVSNAKDNITVTKTIDRPPNVTLDRPSVTVRVEIKPLECSNTASGSACGTTLLVLSLATADDMPKGLVTETGVYTVYAKISAPVAIIATLKLTDFKATVSFAGATAGLGIYTAKVTGPAGVTIESVEPLNIRLVPTVTVP